MNRKRQACGLYILLFILVVTFALAGGRQGIARAGGQDQLFLPLVMISQALPLAASPEASMLELVNQERAKVGCNPIAWNHALWRAAEMHNMDMGQTDFTGHIGSDGSEVGDRTQRAGYTGTSRGENVGTGTADPVATMAGWMSSPGHRANILNCTYGEIGVDYYYLEDDPGNIVHHHYWTQVFGSLYPTLLLSPNPSPPEPFEAQVVELLNEERAKVSCDPLAWNDLLWRASELHSRDMALNDFFDPRGTDLSTWIGRTKREGYTGFAGAESLAGGFDTPQAAVAYWMANQENRDAILDCFYTEIGVGYYHLENDTGIENFHHYWTFVLGTS